MATRSRLRYAWRAALLAIALAAPTAHGTPLQYSVGPLYTTADNPANHVVAPGGPLDGVARLLITRSDGLAGCSGALLPTGRHVLTAAHCLTDAGGALVATAASAAFEPDLGVTESIVAAEFFVHPGWTGNPLQGSDIAVIRLASPAAPGVDRYDIDRGFLGDINDRLGAVGDKVGYGVSGTGATGFDAGSFPFGTKRAGENRYDAPGELLLVTLALFGEIPLDFEFTLGSLLLYDFDNGSAANDAFGFFFGPDGPLFVIADLFFGLSDLGDLGRGSAEVGAAPGDSGSPTFIDGRIAGVASFFFRLDLGAGVNSDVDGVLNASFGEFFADTRVAAYADFVDGVIGVVGVVPEPSTLVLLGLGLVALAGLRPSRLRA